MRVARFDSVGPIRLITDEDKPLEAYLQGRNDAVARRTKEGYLDVRGRMARDGLLQYSDGVDTWYEYRPAAELFSDEATESFRFAPITDDHPPQMLDASSARFYQRGVVAGWPHPEKAYDQRAPDDTVEYQSAELRITDADLISKVEAGKQQLSIGFEAMVLDQPGTYQGQPYRYVQTQIRGNHVAVVDEGRAGPECRVILDGAAYLVTDGADMKTKNKRPTTDKKPTKAITMRVATDKLDDKTTAALAKVLVDAKAIGDTKAVGDMMPTDQVEVELAGMRYLVPTPVAAELERLTMLAAQQPAAEPAPEPTADPAGVDPNEEPMPTPDAKDLQRKIDARVNERTALIADAIEVLGRQPDIHAIADDDLRRRVIVAVDENKKARADAAEGPYLQAMFDDAVEAHRQRDANDRHGAAPWSGEPIPGNDGKSRLDEARAKYAKRFHA